MVPLSTINIRTDLNYSVSDMINSIANEYPFSFVVEIGISSIEENKRTTPVNSTDLYQFMKENPSAHLAIVMDGYKSSESIVTKLANDCGTDKQVVLEEFGDFMSNFTDIMVYQSGLLEQMIRIDEIMHDAMKLPEDKVINKFDEIANTLNLAIQTLNNLVNGKYKLKFNLLLIGFHLNILSMLNASVIHTKFNMPDKEISDDDGVYNFYKTRYGFGYYFPNGIKIKKRKED